MIRPRPITVLLGALAVTGVVRTATAILSHDEAGSSDVFVSAAQAAGSAEEPVAKPAPEPAPSMDRLCVAPEAMLKAMKEERALLDTQKDRLTDRQSEIALAEEKLKIDQTRLLDLKTEVEGLLDRIRQSQTDDVDRLVALYSAMKPKEAAAIMDDLDIETSVMVLATMPERDAAPILAKLNRVRARAISRIILERSKLPGDQRLQGLKL